MTAMSPSPTGGPLLTLQEAATFCRVNPQLVVHWVTSGWLSAQPGPSSDFRVGDFLVEQNKLRSFRQLATITAADGIDVRCCLCVNPATPTHPLFLYEDAAATAEWRHEWAADDGDGDGCPPFAQGYGWCSRCLAVFPFGALFLPAYPDQTLLAFAAYISRNENFRWVAAIIEREYTGDPDLICRPCLTQRGTTATKAVNVRPDATQARAAALPVDGPGLTRVELMTLWGVGERRAHDLAGQLVEAGALVVEEESPSGRGGSPTKRYRRASR